MTHDFRHHIAALSGMLQGGETQQAQDYLAALQEQQTERALMVNTHNSAIDAVLNQKGYAAQKQHIDIQFEVNDLSPLKGLSYFVLAPINSYLEVLFSKANSI